MKPLHTAALADSPRLTTEKKEELAAILRELDSIFQNRPRVWRDVFSLLSHDSCFAITHDASNDGSAAALFIVNKHNASDVTFADLQDPSASQLMDITTKMYNETMQQWSTWEQEVHSRYIGVKKWGQYLTWMFSKLARSLGVTMRSLPPKLVYFYDSGTADKKWTDLKVPPETQHISAKTLRFYNMSDEIAYCTEWPVADNNVQISSQDNSLSHVCSHIGKQLADMEQERQSNKALFSITVDSFAITLHSYHGAPTARDPFSPPPEYSVVSLPINPADAPRIAEAYAEDSTTINDVPLSEIYRQMLEPDKTSAHHTKVSAWSGVRFFLINLPTSGVPLLYT